jgi:hypothetical protein
VFGRASNLFTHSLDCVRTFEFVTGKTKTCIACAVIFSNLNDCSAI